MSSSWAKKLETKISALSESSSKESIQTLAKWIGFNRKHAAAFGPVLEQHLLKGGTVCLSVMHQVLILEQDNAAKWDKLADLRQLLGETLLAFLKHGPPPQVTKEKLTDCIKEWNSANVFGSPTMINQLKRDLAGSQQKSATQAVSPPENNSSVEKSADTKKQSVTQIEASQDKAPSVAKRDPVKDTNIKKSSQQASSSDTSKKPSSGKISPSGTKAVYDFESKGIPVSTVEMKQLQTPCKSLATLQIARDLRNDSAQQISSLLSELPAAVQEHLAKTDNASKISDDTARDWSIQTNDKLLDLDLEEELANIRTFRGIVEKQKAARQLLILLLIKSRCKFGSETAAQAFEDANRSVGELKRRAQVLQDAMDLEGMDVTEVMAGEEQDVNSQKDDQELTLEWFKPGNAAKKTRLE